MLTEMGAYDTYRGGVACPRCGMTVAVDGQTKFFGPDFSGVYYRRFELGRVHPIEGTVDGVLAEALRTDWWQVSARSLRDDLTLLADYDDVARCACGTTLLPILRFALRREAPPPPALESTDRCVVASVQNFRGVVSLIDLRLLALKAERAAAEIDVADVYGTRLTYCHDWQREHDELAAMPVRERIALVRAKLFALASS